MTFRIHPAIGIARVGNSVEYYIGPETMAGMPQEGTDLNGGLPIRPDTDGETITSADVRDGAGALKRQAARFTVFEYDDAPLGSFPSGDGTPVGIGTVLSDGRTVTDIIWTVHLANKKANCWLEVDEEGIASYTGGGLPPLRNPGFGGADDPSAPERLAKLVIDAGPRTIQGTGASVEFDTATPASAYVGGAVTELPDYPKQFPDTATFPDLVCPSGETITTLGGLRTDSKGRLEVLGGHGLACGFGANALPLMHDVNNNGWFDDTSDGPVTAVLVLDDGTEVPLEGSAWAVATDPGYAPQTLNIVSLWDDIYNTWIEHFDVNPGIYANGAYLPDYQPDFYEDIFPVFRAASLQMWNTNLPDSAIAAHDSIDNITPEDDPANRLYVKALIRNPNPDPDGSNDFATGSPLMPLSLGDAGKAFLTLSTSQYFFVMQWFDKKFTATPPVPLGPGERLDKVVLANCLGGRFSPGIDLTFIVRDTELYNSDWTNPAIGPFRIAMAPLDYGSAQAGTPFLGVGYTPTRPGQAGVEPGDICKFMAIPWHTDYNSCATHLPEPNPGGDVNSRNDPLVFEGINTTLFWSWPAQRPVAVYTFDDLAANGGALPRQKFSVRGEGTKAQPSPVGPGPFPAQNVGRFQDRENILLNWQKIGVIMQGPAIEGYDPSYPTNYYLEVASLFEDDADPVIPWPNTIADNPSG
ncbi:LodA/GoxA family CTQ-dependent oxidase [uncultured Salipiger sp.]|uniref:LodA/GoxA family CTQ-dependent oxidase n=1 Tax=uncultured Salipiger sp. TaxID=499810 RepID=UPI00259AACE5|nr:LodA/GoxA family CTQ-dependent oxidase [uncultured Salipiger sp.]